MAAKAPIDVQPARSRGAHSRYVRSGLRYPEGELRQRKANPCEAAWLTPDTDILAANRPSGLLRGLLYPRDTIQYRDWARIIAKSEPKRGRPFAKPRTCAKAPKS
jgi:hypothetical protein